MSIEKFIETLEKLDMETPISERNTLVAIHYGDMAEYKFMSAAGAIGATIQYGPYISLII